MPRYSVVDIFAGPGGLAEGFSSVPGAGDEHAFSIALSIEKETSAHETLRLRSFLRQFEEVLPAVYYDFINGKIAEPDWASLYPDEWTAAEKEAWKLELGNEDPAERLDARLDAIREESGGNVILIGGPPCQAYSLAGRSRNAGKEGYVALEDNRHFLYQEYIRILDRLNPAAFVMENVKGMLSSSVDGENRIFDQVLRDLRGEREGGRKYRLIALDPRRRQQLDLGRFEPRAPDFIVRAEDFGVPQARHRVIVVGLRSDLAEDLPDRALADLMIRHNLKTTVGHALSGMPRLRSGLSQEADGPDAWRAIVLTAMAFVAELETNLTDEQHADIATHRAKRIESLGANLTEEHQPELRAGVAELQTRMAAFPDPLYVQMVLTIDMLRHVMEEMVNYHAQRNPKALAEFHWVIDAKQPTQVTDWEDWWSKTIVIWLQAISLAKPGVFFSEGDYRYFERFRFRELPAYVGEEARRLGVKSTQGIDLSLMFTESFRFSSAIEPGLELVDIVTNALRRAMVGNLGEAGWLPLRSLMIHRPDLYVWPCSLLTEEKKLERPYKRILNHFRQGGRNMLAPRFKNA